MAIEVTDDLVRHIARLSRLAISPDDVKGLKNHFEKILAYIGEFQALDTRDVDPSIFSVEASNVFRDDEVRPSLARDAALANAPQGDGTYFIVPRIVGGSPEPGAVPPGADSRGADSPGAVAPGAAVEDLDEAGGGA